MRKLSQFSNEMQVHETTVFSQSNHLKTYAPRKKKYKIKKTFNTLGRIISTNSTTLEPSGFIAKAWK